MERMLVLDPQARPTATELLADPYFASYCDPDSETCAVPVCRADYAFDRLNRALTLDEVHTNIIRKGGGGGGSRVRGPIHSCLNDYRTCRMHCKH